MGAHSLGGAREANSGYAGAFTPPNTGTFDNEYYQLLVNDRATFTNEVGLVHCHKIQILKTSELALMIQVRDSCRFLFGQANNADAAAGEDLKYQWSLRPGGLMLNTDVELVYDIDVDNYGAGTTCTIPSTCAEASTKSLVESYANVSQGG